MKKIFLIVLFITGVVFAQYAYKGIPGWYKRTPVRKDIVYATGLGNGRIEALIISLDELSSIFETFSSNGNFSHIFLVNELLAL